MLKDKRGEKLLSIWWFLSLVLVGGGIVLGVLLFYSAPVDVRVHEADILSERVLDCLNENGFLIDEYYENGKNFDISVCGLSKMILYNNEFFLKISFNDDAEKTLLITGDPGIEVLCEVQEKGVVAERNAQCVRKKESVLYYDKGEIKLGTL